MNANELMIGDWVQGFVPDTYSRVVAIPYAYRLGIITSRGTYIEAASDDLQPIPLTPEILEKNGFENDFYEEESVADYHTIRLEGYSLKHNIGEIDGYLITWCNGGVNVTTDWDGCVQKEISFVHELQHALRLCGIEKEIEL